MNRTKVVLGVLIWPLGAFWLARHFRQSKGRASLAAVAGFVALIIVISAVSGGNSSSTTQAPPATTTTSSSPPTTTSAATTTTTNPKAQWELIVSQSSCQESPTTTSINCSIGVKNRGSSPGQPTVYALYHYTDGSETTDLSTNGTCRKSDDIPAGQLGYIYFCHNYDPLKHDLLRAATTLNINAKQWPYVRVADPNDANWPDG